MLDAFLVRDTKEPAPKPVVIPQAVQVSNRVDECFLDHIQAGLFVLQELTDIDVKGQLVALKQFVPRFR